MLLSLDFPRDGEVLELSGIQARPELDPRLKRSGVTPLGSIFIAVFRYPVSLLREIYFMFFSALSTRHSTLDTRPFSLDQLVRPSEHLRRNRQADLLRGLEINYKLKLRRLLHGQVSRLGSLQDPVHVICGAAKNLNFLDRIGHQATGLHPGTSLVHRRQSILYR